MFISGTHPISKRVSPPRLSSGMAAEVKPEKAPSSAVVRDTNDNFGQSIKALAGLALTLAPICASAVPNSQPAEVEMVKETDTDIDSTSPVSLLDKKDGRVGDYNWEFTPIDADLKPRVRGGNPVLRLKGEFLDGSIHKTRELGDGWVTRQGANTRFRGEASTDRDPEIDFQAGLFREYLGPVGDFKGRFRGEFGVRHRFLGDHEGTRAGFSFSQELTKDDANLWGQNFSTYIVSSQSLYRDMETEQTTLSYRIGAGIKKEYPVKMFGRDGKLSLVLGPEISGSEGESPTVSTKSKLRLKL